MNRAFAQLSHEAQPTRMERRRAKIHRLLHVDASPIGVFLQTLLLNATLLELSAVIQNISQLRASRVSKILAHLISTNEDLIELRPRLTRNRWLSLTLEEKSLRNKLNRDRRKAELESLLSESSIEQSVISKLHRSIAIGRPLKLADFESRWIDRTSFAHKFGFVVKNGFLIKKSLAIFLPSKETDSYKFLYGAFFPNAFTAKEPELTMLCERMIYDLLSNEDCEWLSLQGFPIENKLVCLNDERWAKNPYAKAIRYRIIKSRQEIEEERKRDEVKRALASTSYKRIHLSDELKTLAIAAQERELISTPKEMLPFKRIHIELPERELIASRTLQNEPSAETRLPIASRLRAFASVLSNFVKF